ncbi:MAG: MBL fold metallo-hydrolase [Planctomycetota bacterium]|jgi:hydroxyacylglutathione hydrolase
MLFERFEVAGLSHYSYAVGCPQAGKLVIVDPERHVDRYLEFAGRHGLTISHVLETHIHADYASGTRVLAERTGAEACVSGHDRGETYETAFAHRDLADGEAIEIGGVRIRALHTPGHTPEHLSYLVYERARSDEVPALMLSGDFLFVGSLGRPDLLGEEAKQGLARQTYASVREKLADLPDGLEIHPAHGAGSMCGAEMGGRPSSTLGFERVANPYLDPALDEQRFVERLLGTVPPFPPYYLRMKQLNAQGAPAAGGQVEAVAAREFQALMDSGHVVVDMRDHLAWSGGHIPGSLGVGAADQLAMWAAWVVPYDRPVLLVADNDDQAGGAVRALAQVGLDNVAGVLAGGIGAWRTAGLPLRQTRVMSVGDLHERLSSGVAFNLLDVRGDGEWSAGHIDGSVNVHAGQLADRLAEVPSGDAPLVVTCAGGYRSTAAISVLERAGYENVINVTGGMDAWVAAGLPVVRAGVEVSS